MVDLIDAPDLPCLVHQHATVTGERTALYSVVDFDHPDRYRSLTFSQLDQRARAVAATLGCEPGDRLLLLYADPLDFAVGFLSCLYAGAVAVPAPLPGNVQQQVRLAGIAADADLTAILVDRASQPAVEDWAASCGLARLPVLTTDDVTVDPAGNDQLPAWSPPVLGRGALALLQYTSGSTAEPRGVMVTHGNLLHNVASLARQFGLDGQTRFGGWIPMYHDMGLIGLLIPALLLGGSAALMRPAAFLRQPARWLTLLDRFGVTITAAPNFGYELCARRVTDEQLARLDLSRLQIAVNGSEPVRAATLDAFTGRFGAAGLRAEVPTPCFGLAEATLLVSGTNHRAPVLTSVAVDALDRHRLVPAAPGEAGRALVSCGVAADFELRIVDPQTREVSRSGSVGEIWLAGGSVAAGYWRNETASTGTFGARTADGAGPFLRTGDLGALHGGELYVTGRLKEMMIFRGRNLYPQDIEHELRLRHEELAGLAGAVFSVPAAGQLDGPALVVTHEVRGAPTPAELSALAGRIRQSVVTGFGVGVAQVLLLRPGSVARTTSGKIQRTAMRDRFLAGKLDPRHVDAIADPAVTLSSLRHWLLARIAVELELPPGRVRPDGSFADYGLDSVSALLLGSAIEDEFGVAVEAGDMWEYPTVDALCTVLLRRLAG